MTRVRRRACSDARGKTHVRNARGPRAKRRSGDRQFVDRVINDPVINVAKRLASLELPAFFYLFYYSQIVTRALLQASAIWPH